MNTNAKFTHFGLAGVGLVPWNDLARSYWFFDKEYVVQTTSDCVLEFLTCFYLFLIDFLFDVWLLILLSNEACVSNCFATLPQTKSHSA